MRRPLLIAVGVAVILTIGGFSLYHFSGAAQGEFVPVDQLPTGFLATARQQLPQVKFDKAWKLPNGNFEIRGKDERGKVREVELNSKGEVVEVD